MVEDGSYSDVFWYGSVAFIVSSANLQQFIIAGGPTPGNKDTQNPYRSELGTIVGMGIMSTILTSITQSSPKITIACDNDNALECPFLPKMDLSANQVSSDLITVAHDIWSQSPATPILVKVQGHADTLGRTLTPIEYLNTVVDQKAKQFLKCRSATAIYRKSDPTYGLIQVSIQGTNISGEVSKSLLAYMASQRSRQALSRTKKMSLHQWNLLDHVAMKRSKNHVSTKKHTFKVKWLARQLPIGK
jgi:hypothetical protein